MICHAFIHVSLDACLHHQCSFINFQSFEYCFTGLDKGLSYHFFHNHGGTAHKTLYACIVFSDLVTHSKFSSLLSFFIPLIWFTCGLFSGFGINARATNLCTNSLLVYKSIIWYCLLLSSFNSLLFIRLLTLPVLLTIYRHSYQGMSFQISVSICRKNVLNPGEVAKHNLGQEHFI